jgi:hypothetical protein
MTTGAELAERVKGKPPAPLYNGVMAPDKWTMFGRMAVELADTDFAPKGLRKNPPALLAVMCYGDSLGLHPMVALKECHSIDGKVGISGALMLALIRQAGHKVKFVTIRDSDGKFIGVEAHGQRMKEEREGRKKVMVVDDEDVWSFTMADAEQAELLSKHGWKKYPQAMCRWRAVAGLARFLFPDVFAGQAIYTPDEAEEAAYNERRVINGAPVDATGGDDEPDYGDDPELAAWLVALFACANTIEQGRWMPKKIKLALKGKTQEEREEVAREVAAWIAEQGVDAPPRPEPAAEDAGEGEIVEPEDENIPFGVDDEDEDDRLIP